MTKGLMLFSGGLDSILASKLLSNQGVKTHLVTFLNPFITDIQTFREKTAASADVLELPITFVDASDSYLDTVRSPEHGYGSAMNPCIDCKIHYLSEAKAMMPEYGAQFLATGEVLGERPMSQTRPALWKIEHDADVIGLVVRPLSAKLLDPTKPEIDGLIDREALLDIQGRSRRPQIALAKEFGITNYPTPAGGCLLTEKVFSARIKDLLLQKELTLENIEILKLGRHFRFSRETRIILGRNKEENDKMHSLCRPTDTLVVPSDFKGPDALIVGACTPDAERMAGSLILRFSKISKGTCTIKRAGGKEASVEAEEIEKEEADKYAIRP